VVLLGFIAPLFAFTPLLVATKRNGLAQYGNFATRYAGRFDRKWLDEPLKGKRDPLGTSDIQSLNDLLGSFEHLNGMRFLLMDRRNFLGLIGLIVTPLAPLVLMKIPLLAILKLLAKSVA